MQVTLHQWRARKGSTQLCSNASITLSGVYTHQAVFKQVSPSVTLCKQGAEAGQAVALMPNQTARMHILSDWILRQVLSCKPDLGIVRTELTCA